MLRAKHKANLKKDYWGTRKKYRYYKEVIRIARCHASTAKSVIEVGPRDTQVLLEFNWIPLRTAIDLEFAPKMPEVVGIHGDFLQYQPDHVFDLVLCLQVLEHLDDPKTFAQKLLLTGKTVILSVPYMWPKGYCKYHLQDPVDENKILTWTGKPFIDKTIVTDGTEKRIIVVFQGNV